MKSSPLLEEILESRGAQGSIAAEFIKHSRVFYRRRQSKQLDHRGDMIMGHGGLQIEYCRMNLGILLKDYTVVSSRPEDPPIDIIRRTFHLSRLDELKVSDMKYDKKRRLHFIRVSAPRTSDVYLGGSRVYIRIVPANK